VTECRRRRGVPRRAIRKRRRAKKRARGAPTSVESGGQSAGRTEPRAGKKGASAGKKKAEARKRTAGGAAPAGPSFPVVAVGLSAGGLEPLKEMLAALPRAPGFALVIVQHQEPTHESLLPGIVETCTALPVAEAESDAVLACNHIYVTPSHAELEVEHGRMRLARPGEPRGRRRPFDRFLRSLAADCAERAVCVVLSGSGSDGTLGVKAIKEHGGLIVVQDPAGAEYDGMPRNALQTGLVDLTLEPAEMAASLARYARHPHVEGHDPAERVLRTEADRLDSILALLRSRARHDFSQYKKPTLVRRIQRRMGLRHVSGLEAYERLLRSDDEECEQLCKDLLIGVTSFFREPEVYTLLAERAVPDLVRRLPDDAPLRVWVLGCATGEEAYSLAMVIIERLAALGETRGLQMIASDVDEHALEVARAGRYSDGVVSGVSESRRKRFFVSANGVHQVSRELRDRIVFATHDVLEDPPFSRMHLVSCRNVLIYLEQEAQSSVLEVLRFALVDGGYLLLGSSETVGQAEEVFQPIAKKRRLYQRRPGRRGLASALSSARPSRRSRSTALAEPAAPGAGGLAHVVRSELVASFAPPSVLADPRGRVLYQHGDLGRYFEMREGEPSRELVAMVRPMLRNKVRAAMRAALRDGERVVLSCRTTRGDGGTEPLRVVARPVSEPNRDEPLVLVSFQPDADPGERAGPDEDEARGTLVEQLESELQSVHKELQSAVEELEQANDELGTAHEEAISYNEELRSTNEELETSWEELQSLNEELETVNAELREKVVELESANDDLANVFASTEIATVFLDEELHIKRFTPATGELFDLRERDISRPLSELSTRLVGDDHSEVAGRVLRSLSTDEQEIRSDDGRWYLRRVIPYRTSGGSVAGVVMTFSDVTELKKVQHELGARLRQQAAAADLSQQALSGAELEPLLAAAARAVADTLDLDRVGIFERLAEGDTLELRAGVGLSEDRREADADRVVRIPSEVGSEGGYALFWKRPIVVDEPGREKRFAVPGPLAAGGAGIAVAIGDRDVPYGVLLAHASGTRAFSEYDVRFVEVIAHVLGLTIYRHALERRVAERTGYMQLLREVARIANRSESAGEAYQEVLDRVCAHFDWLAGHAWMEATDGDVRLVDSGLWSRNPPRALDALVRPCRGREHAPGEGLVGQVYASGRAAAAPGPAQAGGADEPEGAGAVVASPVLIGEEVTAVLEFYTREGPRVSPDTLSLLDQIGIEVGRAAERARADEQRREREAQFAHLGRQIVAGEMASGIAHELNQPLGAIVSGADACLKMLREQGLEASTIAEGVQALKEDGARAGEIIRRLREFVRRAEPRRERVDVNRLVRESLHLWRHEGRERGVRVELDLAEELPPVFVDPVQFQQVLLNLVRNSMDAMAPTSLAERAVAIRTEREGNRAVRVTVEDTGPGLSPEAREKLFYPFYTSKREGMGLGLSIARSIVEFHEGEITGENREEGGARFSFTVPTS